METQIKQYYDTEAPGQVQVLGVDLWNGTPGQVTNYQNQTGVTFPLGLEGSGTIGGNLSSLYGTYNNYFVINKQGIVRYHAADSWPLGNRFHVDELRGTIDSLVTTQTGIGDGPPITVPTLQVAPNPFRQFASVRLSNPADVVLPAEVSVFDVRGARVATLWEGPVSPGTQEFRWDGRAAAGGRVRAGVYFIRARLGDTIASTRVLHLR